MTAPFSTGWVRLRSGKLWLDLRVLPAACAVVAAAIALFVHEFGPPPVDAPAHLFQTLTFARDGFALWNNYWYSGHYEFVSYSIGYYPLATVAGILVLTVISTVVTATMFAALTASVWGSAARLPSLCFAITASVVAVVSGMYPFAAGLAAALVALRLLQTGRRGWAAPVILAVAAFSPLAFLFLLVVLVAVIVAAADRRALLRQNRVVVTAVAATLVGAGGLDVVFSQQGYYPYQHTDLITMAAISIAGLWLTRWRVRRDLLSALFCTYLVINLAVFVVPSPIGANATRLYAVGAGAMIWLACRARRPLLSRSKTGLILAATLAVQLAPYANSAYASFEARASATPQFWRPAISFLQQHRTHSRRVEVVATADHWEAYYMARADISLARGWYRQLDFPQNALLYRAHINPASYRRWLRRLGITYVLLPRTALDYSGVAEAQLLRSGRSGLQLVWHTANWSIYRLPDSVGLISAGSIVPGEVRMGANTVTFVAPRPGRYTIRVRYSPYWHPSAGVCLTQTSDGMIAAHIRRAGPVSLTMPDPIDVVVGQDLTGGGTAACVG